MNGSIVIGFIFCVAALALVIAASAANNKKQDSKKVRQAKSEYSKTGKGSSRPLTNGELKEDDEETKRASSLIVPPPDEKRIEAVAPRNDRGAFRGYRK